MSNQVEIIYSSSRNSKETGEIIRISPRKSARGIRPLDFVHTNELDRSQADPWQSDLNVNARMQTEIDLNKSRWSVIDPT